MAQKNTAQLPLPPALKLLRALFPIIQLVLPPLAKKIGVSFFLKPFRFPLPEREKAVASKAKSKTLKVDQYEIATYEWGSGEEYLLMVHGWSGRAMQFHALIEHFVALGYKVISFDAPGHGKSTGGETNLVEFAACINAIVEKNGDPKALIGHSLGGIACMFYQNHYEKAIPQVTINSPAIPDEIFENYAYRINSQKEKVAKWIRDYTLKRFEREFDSVSGQELSKGFGQVPFLIVNDEDDREVSLENAQVLHEHLLGSEMFITKTFGHVRILRAPELIDRLDQFVQKL